MSINKYFYAQLNGTFLIGKFINKTIVDVNQWEYNRNITLELIVEVLNMTS